MMPPIQNVPLKGRSIPNIKGTFCFGGGGPFAPAGTTQECGHMYLCDVSYIYRFSVVFLGK